MVIKNFIFNRDTLRSRLNNIKLGDSWSDTTQVQHRTAIPSAGVA